MCECKCVCECVYVHPKMCMYVYICVHANTKQSTNVNSAFVTDEGWSRDAIAVTLQDRFYDNIF